MGWEEDKRRKEELEKANEKLAEQIKEAEKQLKIYFSDNLDQVIISLRERDIKTCEELYIHCKKIYDKSIIIPKTSTQLSKSDTKKITLATQKISDHNKSCLIPVLQHILFTGGGCAINSKEHKAAMNSLDLIVDILLDRISHESDRAFQYCLAKEIYTFILLEHMLNNTCTWKYGSRVDGPATYKSNIEEAHKDSLNRLKEFKIDISRLKNNISIDFSSQNFLNGIKDQLNFLINWNEQQYVATIKNTPTYVCYLISDCNLYLLKNNGDRYNITDLSFRKNPGFFSCFTTPVEPIDFQNVYDVVVTGEYQPPHYYG